MKISSLIPSMPKMQIADAKTVMSRLTKLAVPAIALFGMAYAQTADAGPMTCAACVSACSALTGGAFVPACIAACAPICVGPMP